MRAPFNRSTLRAFVIALLATGFAAAAGAEDSSFAVVATLSNVSGEDIYSRVCQGCHMSRGEGAVGAGHYPKLAGDPTLASWRYVAVTVLQGRNNMPAFSAPSQLQWDGPTLHLSDAQVADVVNYLRSHFGNNYKEHVSADDVARLPHPGAGTAP
jgi:mono/diheme cytochrome c family protein